MKFNNYLKEMGKTFGKGMVHGFGMLFMVGILGVTYASLTTVVPGASLTDTIWNDMIVLVNQNDEKLTNITNSGGNVGIGITSAAKLHIEGGNPVTPTNRLELQQNAALTIRPHSSNSTNMNIGQVDSGASMGIQVTNYNALADYHISLNPFGGNVGIGTTSPPEKLSVDGGIILGGGALGSSGKVTLSAYSSATCPGGRTALATASFYALCAKVEAGSF